MNMLQVVLLILGILSEILDAVDRGLIKMTPEQKERLHNQREKMQQALDSVQTNERLTEIDETYVSKE